jgi:hypothetical protein
MGLETGYCSWFAGLSDNIDGLMVDRHLGVAMKAWGMLHT